MTSEMYEILSLLARYFFAGLMVLIVYRGWRITVRDNRRAKVLRDWSPETGCVGQLVIGAGKKARQTLLPIPREGVLGSSRRADIVIRDKGVLPEHAHVESREGGLLIRPLGRAQMALGKGDLTGGQLFAQDGDVLTLGDIKALVVLFEPGEKPLAPPEKPGAEPPERQPDARAEGQQSAAPVARTAGRNAKATRTGPQAPKTPPSLKARTALRKAKNIAQDPPLQGAPNKAALKKPAHGSIRITKPVPRSRDEIDFFDEDAIWREPRKKSKRRN